MINLKLKDIEDVYSKYSIDNNKVISSDIIEYLEESNKIENSLDFSISVHTDKKLQELKRSEFVNCLKNHYRSEAEDLKHSVKRIDIISVICLCIGVALIIMLHFLSLTNSPYIIVTIIEITTWVFIWEFVDSFVFKRFELNKKMKFYKNMMNCNVYWVNPK